MAERSIQKITTEYIELGNNLRETWKYISDLLKAWIVIEMFSLLVVLIGFHFHDIAMQSDSSSVKIAFLFIAFSVLSLIFCFGAAAQNSRLFGSAKAFVERAAYLENSGQGKSYMGIEEASDQVPSSQYVFMNKELYYGRKLNLHNKLTILYAFSGFLWISFIVYVLGIRSDIRYFIFN